MKTNNNQGLDDQPCWRFSRLLFTAMAAEKIAAIKAMILDGLANQEIAALTHAAISAKGGDYSEVGFAEAPVASAAGARPALIYPEMKRLPTTALLGPVKLTVVPMNTFRAHAAGLTWSMLQAVRRRQYIGIRKADTTVSVPNLEDLLQTSKELDDSQHDVEYTAEEMTQMFSGSEDTRNWLHELRADSQPGGQSGSEKRFARAVTYRSGHLLRTMTVWMNVRRHGSEGSSQQRTWVVLTSLTIPGEGEFVVVKARPVSDLLSAEVLGTQLTLDVVRVLILARKVQRDGRMSTRPTGASTSSAVAARSEIPPWFLLAQTRSQALASVGSMVLGVADAVHSGELLWTSASADYVLSMLTGVRARNCD